MPSSYARPWLAGLLLLAGCAAAPPLDPAKPHHTPDGFTNLHDYDPPGLLDFWKWRIERWGKTIPGPEAYDFPLAQVNTAALQADDGPPRLTWIGHATALLQLDGRTVLTDPQFSQRASPMQWAGPQRVAPPNPPLSDLPAIDVVLLSHNHYDSLDVGSVEALRDRPGGDQTLWVVPLGLKPWFADLGVDRVVELDWWDTVTVDGLKITAVPVKHWSKRNLFGRNDTLWAGFVVQRGDFDFFFAGDSGYSPVFEDIARRFPPFDLSLIPIGAYEPRWFMKPHHVNPEEAVQIHRDVDSQLSVAIHWGTFILTDEPLDEPPQKLARALADADVPPERFRVLRHGQTLVVDRSNARKTDTSGVRRTSEVSQVVNPDVDTQADSAKDH